MKFIVSRIILVENNPGKTDPDFFIQLIAKYNLNPEDCFYFDHKQENLDATGKLGIAGVLFENNDQIITYLQKN